MDAVWASLGQDWPPFVLVVGLLLLGLVADADGLFGAAGATLARVAPNGVALYAGAVALVAVVTAVLNLDTSVAFLTPVLVYAARSRGADDRALLAAAILLANASSVFLPGANLTNLIVLRQVPISSGTFAARMAVPGAVAVVVTAGLAAVFLRGSLRVGSGGAPAAVTGARRGLGLAGIAVASVALVGLANPAPVVAAVGAATVAVRVRERRIEPGQVRAVLGLPVLAGLFATAVVLGTLGRSWSGPAEALTGLGVPATAAVAAGAAVVLNNLPAAALLAARSPGHPLALLLGLDLGPNLSVTGSLAWVLWLRAARAVGAQPDLRTTVGVGAVSTIAGLSAAVAALVWGGLG